MKQINYKDAIFNYDIYGNKVTSFYVKTGQVYIRKFIIFGKKQYSDILDYITSVPENIETCTDWQKDTWLEIVYQNYVNNIRG